jgi:hypothetical protein
MNSTALNLQRKYFQFTCLSNLYFRHRNKFNKIANSFVGSSFCISNGTLTFATPYFIVDYKVEGGIHKRDHNRLIIAKY